LDPFGGKTLRLFLINSEILPSVIQAMEGLSFSGLINGQIKVSKSFTLNSSLLPKRRNGPLDFFWIKDVNRIFSLPLSTQATNQLEEVQTLIQ